MTSVENNDPAVTAILAWWDDNQRELPWRKSRDVYAIWIAEVMSAQTTVLRAAAAWTSWMARWPTVDALASASLAEVLAQWQGLGYPRRARDLHRSAQIIVASGWPQDLTELPGVGVYISSAIRCFALEEPVLPRDVNVNRVIARRFPAGVVGSADPWRLGQALMEFGQRICVALPDCAACPAGSDCDGPAPSEVSDRAKRRQKPYAGSLRQRRGQLLSQVLAAGTLARSGVDEEAAEGLIADGLLLGDRVWLHAPD